MFTPSAGPAQALVLHRGVLFPPGVLPSPGEAPGDPKVAGLHHPRPRGPGHHFPVPVLGLRPPPDGGHPRQQAGQQTTTGDSNKMIFVTRSGMI